MPAHSRLPEEEMTCRLPALEAERWGQGSRQRDSGVRDRFQLQMEP